ncbi:5281_t:CDS:2, partial [Funneliformis geosporum]
LKTHISSRASYLSPADYKDIMQYRDMKSKPVTQLSKKYNISNSRLYQIWRGQEFNRIQWNDLAVTPSMNIMNKQNEERQGEREFQDKFDSAFTALENKIHDTKISKSTNPASEEDVISDSKVKKAGGRKSRTKTVCTSDSITSTESSEDVLDLYKRTNNDIEKIRASVSYDFQIRLNARK